MVPHRRAVLFSESAVFGFCFSPLLISSRASLKRWMFPFRPAALPASLCLSFLVYRLCLWSMPSFGTGQWGRPSDHTQAMTVPSSTSPPSPYSPLLYSHSSPPLEACLPPATATTTSATPRKRDPAPAPYPPSPHPSPPSPRSLPCAPPRPARVAASGGRGAPGSGPSARLAIRTRRRMRRR